MYAWQITEIMEKRGFTAEQIRQFFNVYPDKGDGYTEEMADAFEYSVNCPVIEENHPSSYTLIRIRNIKIYRVRNISNFLTISHVKCGIRGKNR